jgi:hypothetical protein
MEDQPPRIQAGPLLSDPSALTTAQLWREIAALKELFSAEIDSIKTSIKVAHDDMVRVPTEVQKQVGGLKELHEQRFRDEAALRDEKFASVQRQFEAVKEAGNKSESAFTKQVDQIEALIGSTSKSFESQLKTLEERVNRGEGRGEGHVAGRVTQQQMIMMIVSLIVSLIVIGSVVVGIAYAIRP